MGSYGNINYGGKWGGRCVFGEYRHNLDAKGRIIVPAKFREGLGEKFYVTRGMDGCLFVYAENEWNLLQEKLQNYRLPGKRLVHSCVSFIRLRLSAYLTSRDESIFQKRCAIMPNLSSLAFLSVSRIELKFGLNNVGKKHRNRRQKVLTIWQKICLILDCR